MMLPIMPWCRIDRVYQVGDVTIEAYRGTLEGVTRPDPARRHRGRRPGHLMSHSQFRE